MKKVLISVYNKDKLDILAPFLRDRGFECISTGGTALFLQGLGIPTVSVESVNKNPEAFDGRIKTLGFSLLAGILFDRGKDSHRKEALKHGVDGIDLVVCNLYPFAEVSKKASSTLDELVENIDIGGVSLIRSAAKNHRFVTVLCDPEDYGPFMDDMIKNGEVGLELKRTLAVKGFAHTYHYDQIISCALAQRFGKFLDFTSPRMGESLRYGENPHQTARVVGLGGGLPSALRHHGKEMSYNNYLDGDSALKAVSDFRENEVFSKKHCVCIVKHGNPCGIGIHGDQPTALRYAWEGDPVSAFGGILCFSGPLEEESAVFLSDRFVEVILAPSFSPKALSILKKKKNLRLLSVDFTRNKKEKEIRSIAGGLLIQDQDSLTEGEMVESVTAEKFSKEDVPCLLFGITACKHMKSNAIVLVEEYGDGFRLVGSGMGNPNRAVSVRQAVEKARENGVKDFGVLTAVSDAFFPFKD